MKVRFAFFQHLSNCLVILSGAGYAFYKYSLFMPASPDPYSNVSHPLEPFFHNAHVLLSPLLVFAIGMLLQNHIIPGLKHLNPAYRGYSKVISGLALTSTAFPMIGSAYLIQISVDETWRKLWVSVHLIASILWTLAYGVHWWRKRRL